MCHRCGEEGGATTELSGAHFNEERNNQHKTGQPILNSRKYANMLLPSVLPLDNGTGGKNPKVKVWFRFRAGVRFWIRVRDNIRVDSAGLQAYFLNFYNIWFIAFADQRLLKKQCLNLGGLGFS